MYERFADEKFWKKIDAERSFNDVQNELLIYCQQTIENVSDNGIGKLW